MQIGVIIFLGAFAGFYLSLAFFLLVKSIVARGGEGKEGVRGGGASRPETDFFFRTE